MESSTKIKPHGTIKVSQIGNANIPAQIRRDLETDEIAFVCDAKTAILFNPDTPYEEVIKSLDILKSDLELRKKQEKGDKKDE
jgi:hypothetical protein